MKRLNFWDVLFVVIVIGILGLFAYSIKVKADRPPSETITIEAKAGNLEREVAESVDIGDRILDRDGRPFFRITEVQIRPSKQAIPGWNNELIAVDSPELMTIEFKAESINPKFKGDNLYYNWELVKPGKNIYMETDETGFVAIIIRVGET